MQFLAGRYSVLQNGETFKRMFQTDYFYVDLVPDVAGAEMCGTLKNIVACGAGVVDGLEMGPNTKVSPYCCGAQFQWWSSMSGTQVAAI